MELSQNSDGPVENGQFIDILLGNFLEGIHDMVVLGYQYYGKVLSASQCFFEKCQEF